MVETIDHAARQSIAVMGQRLEGIDAGVHRIESGIGKLSQELRDHMHSELEENEKYGMRLKKIEEWQSNETSAREARQKYFDINQKSWLKNVRLIDIIIGIAGLALGLASLKGIVWN